MDNRRRHGKRIDATAEGAHHADSAPAAEADLVDEVRKTVGPVRHDEGINAA